jgi:hypothetical protein
VVADCHVAEHGCQDDQGWPSCRRQRGARGDGEPRPRAEDRAAAVPLGVTPAEEIAAPWLRSVRLTIASGADRRPSLRNTLRRGTSIA